MRLAISTVFNILCTQPGQRRGSTTPQELQDTTPTEQVWGHHLVEGREGERVASYIHCSVLTVKLGGVTGSKTANVRSYVYHDELILCTCQQNIRQPQHKAKQKYGWPILAGSLHHSLTVLALVPQPTVSSGLQWMGE